MADSTAPPAPVPGRPRDPAPDGTDAAFRPVRGGNAFEETVERLLQAIKLGMVQDGDRLPPERQLAARLGVSRMTLREAIRDLRRAGYVESRRGRLGGTFVRYHPVEITAPPADAVRRARELTGSLEDVLALRRVLEVGAAELAARRRLSEQERAYLRERLSDCASCPPGGYRQRDSRLHVALAELSGSVSLAAAVADLPLERELSLQPEFHGNAYAEESLPRVPATLREAAALWTDSELARRAFGDEVVDHYANNARVELAAFDAAVTDWERRRGFERL